MARWRYEIFKLCCKSKELKYFISFRKLLHPFSPEDDVAALRRVGGFKHDLIITNFLLGEIRLCRDMKGEIFPFSRNQKLFADHDASVVCPFYSLSPPPQPPARRTFPKALRKTFPRFVEFPNFTHSVCVEIDAVASEIYYFISSHFSSERKLHCLLLRSFNCSGKTFRLCNIRRS